MCECDEAFTYKRNLTLHKRLHAEEESSMEALTTQSITASISRAKKVSVEAALSRNDWIITILAVNLSIYTMWNLVIRSCDILWLRRI